MSEEYTQQVLRVIIAQICQTIGWHSIQSTPLELLVDILHKYLQEITRQTYRHTELYGRTEPNLDDVGLAFRNLGIHTSDIEEYVNYVDSVNCAIDVPKYPAHKDSNLNFLKPGSKEVLTRPVHIQEYLPPICPEKEASKLSPEPRDLSENSADGNSGAPNEASLFKIPDLMSTPMGKKSSRGVTYEEEGRPTREIASVMMTSSGFISPAREGKLPDAKSPILPDYKPPLPIPPPPPQNSIVPFGGMECKFDKKGKKRSAASTIGAQTDGKDKKRDRERAHQQKEPLKSIGNVNDTSPGGGGGDRPFPKIHGKQKKTKVKPKYPSGLGSLNQPGYFSGRLQPLSPILNELTATKSQGLNLPNQSQQPPMTTTTPGIVQTNVLDDGKPLLNDPIKLSSEPDKQKLNIFKKITKKDKDDLSKSPNIYNDHPVLSTLSNETSVILIDDGQKPCTSSSATKLRPSDMIYPPIPTLLSSNLNTTISPIPKHHTNKRPRKKQQQQLPSIIDQQPLNLSNEMFGAINMVKKDLIQYPKLPFPGQSDSILDQSLPSNKTMFKEKKDRKKPKLRVNKKRPSEMYDTSQIPQMFSNKLIKDNPFIVDKDLMPSNPKIPKTSSQRQQQRILQEQQQQQQQSIIPSSFSTMPVIPMFPFYSFPSRPGLIPNTPLFPPIASMPDNPAFNKYLSMMQFSNLKSPTRDPRRPSRGFDPEPLAAGPSSSLSIETDKSYCNVAPLMPDSLKFQLSSPTRSGSGGGKSSSSSASKISSAATSTTTTSNKNPVMDSSPSINPIFPAVNTKSIKFSDAPIEISDDERRKSDDDDRNLSHHSHSLNNIGGMAENTTTTTTAAINDSMISDSAIQATYTNTNKNADHTPIDCDGGDMIENRTTDPTAGNSTSGGGGVGTSSAIGNNPDGNNIEGKTIGNEGAAGMGSNDDRDDKFERRKEREHKKGKKGKDGKIKKKKDKKDKSKSKDKDKRKEKDDKKDKDKTKKLKKEKKKEKRALAAAGISDESKTGNVDFTDSSTVPKLTFKFSTGSNSPQQPDSMEGRKVSLKSMASHTDGGEEGYDEIATLHRLSMDNRRESSPELARISPLVTRPPKQKPNPKEKSNSDDCLSAVGSTTSGSAFLAGNSTQPSTTTHNSSGGGGSAHGNNIIQNVIVTRGPGRPRGSGGNSHHHQPSSTVTSSTIVSSSLSPVTKFMGSSNTVNMTPGNTLQSSNATVTSSSSSHVASSMTSSTSATNKSHNNSHSNIKLTTNSTSTTAAVSCANQSVTQPTDAEGNQVWICPACGRVDDGTPMIGCDGCDAWYHWVCVGIQVPPDANEDWYCRVCIAKKQEAQGNDKKRKRKKKNKAN